MYCTRAVLCFVEYILSVKNSSTIMTKAKKGKKEIVPLGDRVVIKREEKGTEKTASGIIIPETAQEEKPQLGSVVAVGEGRRTDEGDVVPIRVKVGDTVLFSRFGPDEVEIEGESYLVVSESNLLAVIK